MAEDSAFRGIIDFFVRIGIYDVILPFLLVFTIVFALLEKTKVLGTEKDEDGNRVTKRNLNSMVAFCIGFFVILSKELVAIINETLANLVILLLISVSFLLLMGSFIKESDEPVYLKGGLKIGFIAASLIGIALIFLNAVKTENGDSWLYVFWDYLMNNWDQEWVAAIIFIALVVLFMWWITRAPQKSDKKKKSSD